jgi:hypothetical protein
MLAGDILVDFQLTSVLVAFFEIPVSGVDKNNVQASNQKNVSTSFKSKKCDVI